MLLASDLHTLALPLGLGAAAATLLWGLLVLGLVMATRSRRPEPQPAGLEPGGPEPPAVVDLVCHGWKLGREALPATLVDLAARKVIRFTSHDGSYEVEVSGSEPPDLTSYERQVLAHVRSLAHAGVVPCEALTTGPEDESRRWFRRFERAVIADARARGLSRPRWSRTPTLVVGVAALVPAGLASGAISVLSAQTKTQHSSFGAFAGLALIAWFALMSAFAGLRAERDTPAGLQSAGRWLGLAENLRADGTFPDLPPTAVAVWDRYLAYAVAFGLAATTARAVPLGSESDTEAWSAAGGHWHVVRVRYPTRIPPGWGRPPWTVLIAGLFESVVLGGLLVVVAPALLRAGRRLLDQQGGDQQALTLGLKAAFFVYVILVAGWLVRAVWMLVFGLLDVGRANTVEGRLLRLRRREENDSGVVTHVAVDDGTADHVRAWIPRTSPLGLVQGRHVRAVVSPRLGFVRSLEVIAASRTADHNTPTDASAPGRTRTIAAGPAAIGHAVRPPFSLDVGWASQLVGVPLGLGASEGDAGLVTRLEGEGAHIMVSLAPAGMGAEMYRQAARVPHMAQSAVEGVGDEALWIFRSTLVARRDDRVVTVVVRVKGLDGDRRLHIARELAERSLRSDDGSVGP